MESLCSDLSSCDWLHEVVERLFHAFWISSVVSKIGFQKRLDKVAFTRDF